MFGERKLSLLMPISLKALCVPLPPKNLVVFFFFLIGTKLMVDLKWDYFCHHVRCVLWVITGIQLHGWSWNVQPKGAYGNQKIGWDNVIGWSLFSAALFSRISYSGPILVHFPPKNVQKTKDQQFYIICAAVQKDFCNTQPKSCLCVGGGSFSPPKPNIS